MEVPPVLDGLDVLHSILTCYWFVMKQAQFSVDYYWNCVGSFATVNALTGKGLKSGMHRG